MGAERGAKSGSDEDEIRRGRDSEGMSDTTPQPMSLVIRQFAPADYAALAEIWNANYPDYPTTPGELQIDDRDREKRCRRERWVGEVGGRVVGFGCFDQPATSYHPRRYSLTLSVLPDFQRRGIGSALYECVAREVAQYDPLSLRAIAGEDMAGRIRFLEARGFRDESRCWESELDVSRFDSAPFTGVEERIQIQGIGIRTMRELETEPDRDRKLHELISDVQADMPSPEPYTRLSYEAFLKRMRGDENLLPDAFFVAVDGGDYVGVHFLRQVPGSRALMTGDTGVTRTHRRRGLALALKLRGIGYARAHGHPFIRTLNDSSNQSILALNHRLGFRRSLAWVGFIKEFTGPSTGTGGV
ncbi:MAG TPA: GNAT family N-acetyltransferase [bacterium]|nr:GNAT family N-acetyltransferase [bacterium]